MKTKVLVIIYYELEGVFFEEPTSYVVDYTEWNSKSMTVEGYCIIKTINNLIDKTNGNCIIKKVLTYRQFG